MKKKVLIGGLIMTGLLSSVIILANTGADSESGNETTNWLVGGGGGLAVIGSIFAALKKGIGIVVKKGKETLDVVLATSTGMAKLGMEMSEAVSSVQSAVKLVDKVIQSGKTPTKEQWKK